MSAEVLDYSRTHQSEQLTSAEAPTSLIEPFKGQLEQLGMVAAEGGYNFAISVDSEVVRTVDLCIHDPDNPFYITRRWRMGGANHVIERVAERGDTTHTIGGFVPALDAETGQSIGEGTMYSLRVVDSNWTRNDGIATPDIPLIDPRARRVLQFTHNEFAQVMNSVPSWPVSLITTGESYEDRGIQRPEIKRSDLNICELHVRSATLGMPMDPSRAHLQGTYAGLATPEHIAYLDQQGYNAVSILPVHLSASEPHLVRQGRYNFWGYSTASYFALNESYASSDDTIGEFKEMVDALHVAGKQVLLDVVYNHTAEGGVADPTYSYEALNRKNIYALNESGNLVENTGCGNMLDMTKPAVIREIVESLRYWVTEMGVDGFRFDLAGVLTHGHHDIDQAPLMKAIAGDEVLSGVVLIAEPWAAYGDYKLDEFRHAKSAEWMAWSDKYRELARQAMFGVANKQDLSNKLLGHDAPDRTINYVTAHDGNTLRDLVGKNVAAERFALALLAISQGIPQRQAGSDFGYSQASNPDAYDCEVGQRAPYLLPWQKIEEPGSTEAELYDFSAAVNRLRNEHPIFRQASLLTGKILMHEKAGKFVAHPLGEKDVAWLGAFGLELTEAEWNGPDQFFGMHLSGLPSGDDANFVVLINGNDRPVDAALGHDSHQSSLGIYEEVVNTATGFATSELGVGRRITEERVAISPRSLIVLRQIAQRLPGVKGKLE